jgi:RNA polymerase sigma-70 factor, ECF subfamily
VQTVLKTYLKTLLVATASESDESLISALAEKLEAACAPWNITPRQLATLGWKNAEQDVAMFTSLHFDELALAYACAQRHPGALTKLRSEFFTPVCAQLRRFTASGISASDIDGMLTDRLLLHEASIATYGGRGSLEGWIRITATRLVLNAVRAKQSEDQRDAAAIDTLLQRSEAPDERIDKQALQRQFKEAFAKAAATLTDDERDALRMHVYENLSIDDLADVFGVHRATAARWLSRARERLLEVTQREFGASLRMHDSEVGRITGMLLSQVDLSISRALLASERETSEPH